MCHKYVHDGGCRPEGHVGPGCQTGGRPTSQFPFNNPNPREQRLLLSIIKTDIVAFASFQHLLFTTLCIQVNMMESANLPPPRINLPELPPEDCFLAPQKPPCDCGICEQTYFSVLRQKATSRHTFCTRQCRAHGDSHEEGPALARYQSPAHSEEELAGDLAREVESLHRQQKQMKFLTSWYGDTILSKWKRKNKDARRATLLAAFPDIFPRDHFPYHATEKTSVYKAWILQLADDGEPAYTHLVPWINLEALSKDTDRLIALLHYRAQNHPQEWFSHDLLQLHYAWKTNIFGSIWSDKCIDVMTKEHYGDFVDFDPSAAHRLEIVGFPRARMVIMAQGHILSFLQRVIHCILTDCKSTTDIADESLQTGDVRWLESIERGFKLTKSTALWSTFTKHHYSAPTTPKFGDLLLVVNGRVTEL